MFTLAATQTLECLVARFFPRDEIGPGAAEIGVCDFIARRLIGDFDRQRRFERSLSQINELSVVRYNYPFWQLSASAQDAIIDDLVHPDRVSDPLLHEFAEDLITLTVQGLFSHPRHGGNRDMSGWRLMRWTNLPPGA